MWGQGMRICLVNYTSIPFPLLNLHRKDEWKEYKRGLWRKEESIIKYRCIIMMIIISSLPLLLSSDRQIRARGLPLTWLYCIVYHVSVFPSSNPAKTVVIQEAIIIEIDPPSLHLSFSHHIDWPCAQYTDHLPALFSLPTQPPYASNSIRGRR